jgi:hypothetical protein
VQQTVVLGVGVVALVMELVVSVEMVVPAIYTYYMLLKRR